MYVRNIIKISALLLLLSVSLNMVGSKNFVYAQACIASGDECVIGGTPPCCAGSICTELANPLLPPSCIPNSGSPVIVPPGSGPVLTVPIIEIGPLFGALASILIPGGIGLALIRIAWAGYKFMTSEGNPQKVEEAREDLTAAIIGAIFILLSVVILRVILSSFLGAPGF